MGGLPQMDFATLILAREMLCMRWILLLLIPSIASAADGLTGVWSAKFGADQNGFNRVVIVDANNQIYFHYESDYGHRCEVFGVAKRQKSGLYVYKNDSDHNFYANHESYGLEENRDCAVSFEHDGGLMLKVRTTGNCKSFCGVANSIGGDLFKVANENLAVRASE